MRSAQRYTARDKRNTQKLEKQSEICAPLRLVMVVADFHVADRVKISTCSLLVLGGLFATVLSGGAGQGRRNSLAAYFLCLPKRDLNHWSWSLYGTKVKVQQTKCVFPKARLGKQQLEM